MGSMQWQLGREMGTIPAFASRTQENEENLGRGGRSQDLPDSGYSFVGYFKRVSVISTV